MVTVASGDSEISGIDGTYGAASTTTTAEI